MEQLGQILEFRQIDFFSSINIRWNGCRSLVMWLFLLDTEWYKCSCWKCSCYEIILPLLFDMYHQSFIIRNLLSCLTLSWFSPPLFYTYCKCILCCIEIFEIRAALQIRNKSMLSVACPCLNKGNNNNRWSWAMKHSYQYTGECRIPCKKQFEDPWLLKKKEPTNYTKPAVCKSNFCLYFLMF